MNYNFDVFMLYETKIVLLSSIQKGIYDESFIF